MSMNRQKLLDILSHPQEMSDKDLEELENAVQQYPYFQLGYSLIAKAKYDRQTPDAYDSLSVAAVYAPDRSTLKKIFYDNLSIDSQVTQSTESTEEVQTVANTPSDIAPESAETNQIEEDNKGTTEVEPTEVDTDIAPAAAEEEQDTITPADHPPAPEETDTPKMGGKLEITEAIPEAQRVSIEKKEEDEAVYQELEENLKSLRKNKLNFDEEEEEDTKDSDKKKTINETVLPEKESANVEITTSSDTQKKTSTENKKSNREKRTSRLITEISSLQPLPSDHIKAKQQTQFSLIDKFISDAPEIVYNDQNSLAEQLSDLSEKSTLIRDHLLTENFAAIMTKQGKVDKAIEIYRKLIWKFPQKKAYFASKVKALKESE